ncbi:MAG: carbohydrate binding domain-containing protein [Ruminococcus sp.]|nr:carbohydrate binding domain-containing protein [Ruminococcus sp.]
MNLRKSAGRLLSGITAAALFAALIPSLPEEKLTITAYAADAVVVDTTTEYQTIRGFGGINLPEWVGSDMTSAQVQKAFGNGKDELGLSILRVYVNDDKNQWNKAVPTALAAQKLGATVFATPWNPPSSIRENGSGGIRGGKYHVRTDKYTEYAQHLNDFYHYMKNQGVNLYSISVQNEPDYSSEWTAWSSDETTNFLANYADKIDCKVMSPETFQYTNKDYYTKILNNPKAMANCDLFGTHFYGTQRSQMDFPALESSGKEIWMTEVYVPDSNSDADEWPKAIAVAENIHNGLVVGNLNAYVWWYIRRSYGPMKENGNISKRGYCMAQYSKFVRPGDVRIAVTEQPASDVYVSAYKNDNDQITIVAVNKGSDSYAQSFKIGSGEKITDIDRYRTSANENIALTENLENDGTSFWAQLPSNSVSTFVVTLEGEGHTPGTILDEDGYYFHDTFEGDTFSWTGRGDATVLTSGRTAYAGQEALLVQERSASWNGTAKALNTKAFVPGSEYSFSVDAMYLDGGTDDTFKLTLQYKDSEGTVKYGNIATAPAVKGEWVQLANTNYKIPEGATDLLLYVETDSSDINFYIDEAIGAPGGTEIAGAGQAKKIIKGDIDFDGRVDAFDTALLRKGLISGGFSDNYAASAADVNGSGSVEIADLVLHQYYVLGDIKSWTDEVKKNSDDVNNPWDTYTETASAEWINFYKDSIYSMGNTYRLASKLSDAEEGKPLTVAYLGGSITEGKKYTAPFSSYVDDTFAKGTFKEINAGMSGTSSVVGLVRSDKDILSSSPDIIFLEFSVNDHEDIMYKKSFESLVKKCLSQPNEPAVIVLINRAKGGFSSQTQMAAIGNNFDVPVISMDNALTKAFNSGFLSTSDYYTDEYHPHDKGGQLISDCLAYFFRQAMKTENSSASYSIPTTTVYGSEYASCANASVSDLSGFSAGSFTAGTGYGSLPYGYTFQKNSANTPMTFKTTGKGLVIVFKANSSGMGSINVTVNGKTTKVNGNKQYTWGGPDAELGYYQSESGELDVSISMENAGTDFTIWGIGVIK